jgi:trigger factor
METKQKKLPKSQMEIEFELTAEEFQKHIDHAFLHLKRNVKIDGFRPGQAPAKIVEERVGKENLLMEAGDIAVKDVYLKYIAENKLEPIGQPEVSIIKIAQGSPFIFKTKITLLPEVELPDYKEIAKKVKGKEVSVTEEEVQDALNYLQKTRAKFTAEDRPAAKKDFVEITYQNKDINEGKEVPDKFILGEGGFMKGFEDNIVGMKAGEEKEFTVKFPDNSLRKDLAGKEIAFKVKMFSVQKIELPEINDEFVKQLGKFQSLVALKDSIKNGITIEKNESEKQRKRGEILDKISEKTKMEVPETMVNYEKERLLEDLKNKIEKMFNGSSFSAQGRPASGWEEYLSSIKKTEAEIKETYQKEAEKRIRNFLVLREIGKREGVEVMNAEVEEEVNKIIKNYSQEKLKKIDIGQLKEYTKNIIQNEKIFQLLENFSK